MPAHRNPQREGDGAMSVARFGPLPGPVRGAALGLGLAASATTAALATLPFEGALGPAAGLAALVATGLVVVDRVADFHPHPRFGLGNAVTLARAGGTAVVVALAFEPRLAVEAGWAVFGFAALLLALDGVDGRLARRQGFTSAFGARFDLEVDALLVLALAGLALGLGKAGPFVLAAGLMRYAFVAAGRLLPRLRRPLPPSRRRRAVCGATIAGLALLLAPPVAPPLSTVLALLVVAALAGSFARDVAWLLRAP